MGKAEKFQKSFDLFKKITTDSYQIGALAIGGPFVALLALIVQQGFLPLVGFLWRSFIGPTPALNELISTLGGFFAILATIAIWVIVSAWMDMRSVVVGLGIPEIEHRVFAYAKIRVGRQIPFDILLCLSLVGAVLASYMYLVSGLYLEHSTKLDLIASFIFNIIIYAFALCLGLVALVRRLWLSKRYGLLGWWRKRKVQAAA